MPARFPTSVNIRWRGDMPIRWLCVCVYAHIHSYFLRDVGEEYVKTILLVIYYAKLSNRPTLLTVTNNTIQRLHLHLSVNMNLSAPVRFTNFTVLTVDLKPGRQVSTFLNVVSLYQYVSLWRNETWAPAATLVWPPSTLTPWFMTRETLWNRTCRQAPPQKKPHESLVMCHTRLQ